MKHLTVNRCESQGLSLGIWSGSGSAEQMGKQQVFADATHETLYPQLTLRLNSHEIGPFVDRPPPPTHMYIHWFSMELRNCILRTSASLGYRYLEVRCDSGLAAWGPEFLAFLGCWLVTEHCRGLCA